MVDALRYRPVVKSIMTFLLVLALPTLVRLASLVCGWLESLCDHRLALTDVLASALETKTRTLPSTLTSLPVVKETPTFLPCGMSSLPRKLCLRLLIIRVSPGSDVEKMPILTGFVPYWLQALGSAGEAGLEALRVSFPMDQFWAPPESSSSPMARES